MTDATAANDEQLADAAGDRATALAWSGEYDAALAEARSAVDGYRRLVAREPDVFLPDLAAALDSLASRSGEVGRRADAADAAQESVALFRVLAGPALDRVHTYGRAHSDTDGPDAEESALFIPYLAAAMSNLSVRQHESGDDTIALETARESTALYRALTTPIGQDVTQPVIGGLLPDKLDHAHNSPLPLSEHSAGFAMALGNLANRLDDAHQLDQALAISGQAAAVYQQLIVVDTDRFRPLLAQTINNRAVLLRESGETAVAISTTRQAVNLYRSLAATQPQKYRDYLAMALGNLANMLTDAGRGRDALAIAQEATEIYRQLAAETNTAETNTAETDTAEANSAAIDTGAATPQTTGAPTTPDNPYDAPLAMSLNNLAVHLSEADRKDEALTATREASTLYRKLARRSPQVHLGNLAGTLTNLGSDLAAAGHAAEALAATREAVDVTRRLAFGNRPAYLPQLAQAVNNLALRMHEAGRDSSALASARECARLYEELAQKDPDKYADAIERTRELASFLASEAV
ncbi:MAG: tetratricopeptide repeat protein [Nakamurella sp.]